jgi:hypothetical protein
MVLTDSVLVFRLNLGGKSDNNTSDAFRLAWMEPQVPENIGNGCRCNVGVAITRDSSDRIVEITLEDMGPHVAGAERR